MTFAVPTTVRRRTLALLATATVASSVIAASGTEPSVTHETHTTAVRAANAASFRPVPLPAPDVDGALREEVAELKAAQPQPEPEPVEEPAAPAPPPAPPAPPAPVAATGSVWDRLAMCESSGNWASSVGTYEGGLQFHPSTWDAYKPAGYPEAAYQASREQQIHVAEKVLARQGWGAWPACSRKLGLR